MGSTHPFELVDEPGDHRQTLLPEAGIAGIEAEGGEKLAMAPGAAGAEHVEIFGGKTLIRPLIDGIKRVHQAIAESIGVDVEGRMDEMRDVAPVVTIFLIEADRRSEAR